MKILFVCRGNIGRSQMAEAFFARLSKKNTASSAGTNSRDEGVEGVRLGDRQWDTPVVMKEIGIDISAKRSKQLTPELVEKADKLIVIMTKEESERLLRDYAKKSGKVELWEIEDGKHRDKQFMIETREILRKKVEELVEEIG